MNDGRNYGCGLEPATEDEAAKPSGIDANPLLPEDFYIEDGLVVFTAAYHRKRGYCCGSGCRHCPYEED
ncbi:MAG TPA: DUF5522 domain-containing protein [Candidatus Aquilonibacter sp.]|nr:DUF5522 domain-containing protein [Candidatus Aquilonibacter sp.]